MLTLHFAPNSRAGRIVWLLEELALPTINKIPPPGSEVRCASYRHRWVECLCWMMAMFEFLNLVPSWNTCWLDTRTAG